MKKIETKGPIVSDRDAWVYDWLGIQCISSEKVARMLEEAGGDEVILEISSAGGSVMAGYEIYKSLMDYPGKITAHVIVACSAATFLACAADKVKISDGGIYMIHNVQSRAAGDYRDMQMEADALKQFNEGIVNIYERKTGKSREELQQLMDQNTYMSPARAIEYGFVDGYIYERRDSAETQSENTTDFVHSVVASCVPTISQDRLNDLVEILRKIDVSGEVAPVQPQNRQQKAKQNSGERAGSDNKEKERGGKNKMTLNEFLAENPEERAEIDTLVSEALARGVDQERERLKSLDAIATTVSNEILNEAKYGKTPMDGPTLAYQAMMQGEQAAAAYMKEAMADSETSGSSLVGVEAADADRTVKTDESDEMASYINRTRGGKTQ